MKLNGAISLLHATSNFDVRYLHQLRTQTFEQERKLKSENGATLDDHVEVEHSGFVHFIERCAVRRWIEDFNGIKPDTEIV